MEVKGYEDRVKVYLRILGDSTISQYPRTITMVTPETVRVTGIQSSQCATHLPEGFLSRNKLQHTPPPADLQRPAETGTTDTSAARAEVEYAFDHVFELTDSLEFLRHYVELERAKLHCVVTVGKSDTALGAEGLAFGYLKEAFADGGEVEIGCAVFSGDKVTNYLRESYERVQSIEALQSHPGIIEFFQGKKAKDAISVFSVFYTRAGVTSGAQFVDAASPSKAISLLCQVITNSDSVSDLRTIAKCRVFDVLRRTLCHGSRIVVIGNVYPVEPYNEANAWVLSTTQDVMASRYRTVTFTIHLLLKNIARLEGENAKLEAGLSTAKVRHKEEKELLIKEHEELKEALKDTILKGAKVQSDLSISLKRTEQELNDVKNLLMLRETELVECKTRVQEMEADLSRRKQGIATQFQNLSQPAADQYADMTRENDSLRRQLSELEVTANGLRACLQSRRVNEYIQIDPSPERASRLSVARVGGCCVYPSAGSRSEAMLTAQLRAAEAEVQRIRSAPSDDLSQSKALYNLLTECWVYTDSALRSLKEQFDKMLAVMEFKVADRELKIAHLEHRIKLTDGIHGKALQDLDQTKQQLAEQEKQRAYIKQLEESIAATKAETAAMEKQKTELRDDFARKMHEMKENYKKSIKDVKNAAKSVRPDTAQLEELQALVRRLQAEVEEKNEEIAIDRERAKAERKELESQISALKDLRKPLGTANRK